MKINSSCLIVILIIITVSPLIISGSNLIDIQNNTPQDSADELDFHWVNQIGDRGLDVIVQQSGPDIFAVSF